MLIPGEPGAPIGHPIVCWNTVELNIKKAFRTSKDEMSKICCRVIVIVSVEKQALPRWLCLGTLKLTVTSSRLNFDRTIERTHLIDAMMSV